MGYGNFSWQPRFHDRIIRNYRELRAKQQYINKNPQTWHLPNSS